MNSKIQSKTKLIQNVRDSVLKLVCHLMKATT